MKSSSAGLRVWGLGFRVRGFRVWYFGVKGQLGLGKVFAGKGVLNPIHRHPSPPPPPGSPTLFTPTLNPAP